MIKRVIKFKLTEAAFIAMWNNRKKYKSVADISIATKLSRKTLVTRAIALRTNHVLIDRRDSIVLDDASLIKLYNDISRYPTLASIAEATGLSKTWVGSRACTLRVRLGSSVVPYRGVHTNKTIKGRK